MNATIEKNVEERRPVLRPACSVCEDQGAVTLKIEMPGVAKEGIDVKVEKNELLIQGMDARAEQEGRYLIQERRKGEYRKKFIIDESVDRDRIEATMVDGVLTLTLHLKEAAKPRKIEIK